MDYEYTRFGPEGDVKILRREKGSTDDWQVVTDDADLREAEIELRAEQRLRDLNRERSSHKLAVRRVN